MMKKLLRILGIVSSALFGLLAVGWIGLRFRPTPFPPYPEQPAALEMVQFPTDLPPPVARFYQVIAGEQIPQVTSAVISGRASLRLAGITFPTRLRFTHVAGQDYRHYIEATIFKFPLLKVNEYFLDGHSRLELPVGIIENEPKVDMAANLGLWGESIWLPSIYITDPRVRWEAIDEFTARLVVPFGDEEDTFTVIFDPQSGLIQRMEALRYKQATDGEKTRWLLEALEWDRFNSILVPSLSTVTWEDEGLPWLTITLEELVYNVDVSAYIHASGP
jgi:hypothetical protein